MAVGYDRFKAGFSEDKHTIKVGDLHVIESVKKAIESIGAKFKIPSDKETIEVMLEEFVCKPRKRKSSGAVGTKKGQLAKSEGVGKPVKGLSKE